MVAIVSPPSGYRTTSGATLPAASHELQARIMSMQTPHRSYAVSGGICTAAAAAVEGTLVRANAVASAGNAFRIAHPYGTMDIAVDLVTEHGALAVRSAVIGRTARRIMRGEAFVPASVLDGVASAAR